MLVGALNMGEYAYDFTGENVHDGPSRNPHDPTRMTGGSSGGSGGAVGGGLVPICAGFGHQRFDPGAVVVLRRFWTEADLRPAVPRAVVSVCRKPRSPRSVRAQRRAISRWPMTRCRGLTPTIAACTTRPVEPVTPLLAQDIGGLRVAVAGGYFQKNVFPEAVEAVARVAKALGATTTIEIPEAARARAAAYVITTTEGASLHLDRLRKRPNDFDPAVRDRLIAGAMVPAPLVDRAQKFRRWYRAQVLELFKRSMSSSRRRRPASRRKLGQVTVRARRRRTAGARQYRHLHPADLLHRPAGRRGAGAAGADADRRADHRAPWREDIALRVAHALEQQGVATAQRPPMQQR